LSTKLEQVLAGCGIIPSQKFDKIGTYQTKDYIQGTKIIDIDKASRVAWKADLISYKKADL